LIDRSLIVSKCAVFDLFDGDFSVGVVRFNDSVATGEIAKTLWAGAFRLSSIFDGTEPVELGKSKICSLKVCCKNAAAADDTDSNHVESLGCSGVMPRRNSCRLVADARVGESGVDLLGASGYISEFVTNEYR